jgi:serine/threonine protein kinase
MFSDTSLGQKSKITGPQGGQTVDSSVMVAPTIVRSTGPTGDVTKPIVQNNVPNVKALVSGTATILANVDQPMQSHVDNPQSVALMNRFAHIEDDDIEDIANMSVKIMEDHTPPPRKLSQGLSAQINSDNPLARLNHVAKPTEMSAATIFNAQVSRDQVTATNIVDRPAVAVVNPITTPEGKEAEITKNVSALVTKHKGPDGKLNMDALLTDASALVKKGGIGSDLTWSLLIQSEEENLNIITKHLKNAGLTMTDSEIGTVAEEILIEMMDSVPKVDSKNKIKINDQLIRPADFLGAGAYGAAYLYNTDKGNFVAKVPENESDDPVKADKLKKAAILELEAHRNASTGDHPNVLKIIGIAVTEKGGLVPITEVASGGDLSGIRDKIDKANISPAEKMIAKQYILRKVMEGMDHIQITKNIAHFDLKPENIFFDSETMEPKIADFGTAKKGNINDQGRVGTAVFMSPEVSSGKGTKRSDTWSLGVMMHEFMFGKVPFNSTHEENSPQFIQEIQGKLAEFASDKNNKLLKLKTIDPQATAAAKADFISKNPVKTLADFGGDPLKLTAYNEKRATDLAKITVFKTPQDAASIVINQMMHPDPEQRPTLEAVKKLSFFTDSMGTDVQAKAILKKIMG